MNPLYPVADKIFNNLLNSTVTFQVLSFHVKRNVYSDSWRHLPRLCARVEKKYRQISQENCYKIIGVSAIIKYNLVIMLYKVNKWRNWTCKHYCTYMEICVTAQVPVDSCILLSWLYSTPPGPPSCLLPRGFLQTHLAACTPWL